MAARPFANAANSPALRKNDGNGELHPIHHQILIRRLTLRAQCNSPEKHTNATFCPSSTLICNSKIESNLFLDFKSLRVVPSPFQLGYLKTHALRIYKGPTWTDSFLRGFQALNYLNQRILNKFLDRHFTFLAHAAGRCQGAIFSRVERARRVKLRRCSYRSTARSRVRPSAASRWQCKQTKLSRGVTPF